MPDHDPGSAGPSDLVERALALIQDGRVRERRSRKPKNGSASMEDATFQRQRHVIERDARVEATLDDYFRSLRSAEIISAIQQLESGNDFAETQRAMKVLAAFFRWSAISGASLTHDLQPINELAARFAVAVSCRLAGPLLSSERTARPVHPEWQSPDIALGWRAPKHRQQNLYEEPRAAGIIAMWVKLAADKVSPGDRELRIGEAFGVGRSTVRKALADWPEYRRLFESEMLKMAKSGTQASARLAAAETHGPLSLDAFIREGIAYSKSRPKK